MAVDMTKLLKVKALDSFAAKADAKIKEVETKANASFKGAKVVNGNTIALYKGTDTTGTPDLTLDLAAEMVVDAAKTGFVPKFAFSAETYAGAENPNLEGKAVLVLAIKTTDKGVDTTSYSFISVDSLVDIYTAKDKSITVNGYEIKVNISEADNNALTLKNDGLHVDISGKTDKVTGATAGNIATLTAEGNLADGNIAAADILVDSDVASDEDVSEVLKDYFKLDNAGE